MKCLCNNCVIFSSMLKISYMVILVVLNIVDSSLRPAESRVQTPAWEKEAKKRNHLQIKTSRKKMQNPNRYENNNSICPPSLMFCFFLSNKIIVQ